LTVQEQFCLLLECPLISWHYLVSDFDLESRGNISRTAFVTVVFMYQLVVAQFLRQLTGPADSVLSRWAPYTVISLEAVACSSYCNTVEWFLWDWSLSQWPTGFLQCFDAVGWVIWPATIVYETTYKVSSGTLSFYWLTDSSVSLAVTSYLAGSMKETSNKERRTYGKTEGNYLKFPSSVLNSFSLARLRCCQYEATMLLPTAGKSIGFSSV